MNRLSFKKQELREAEVLAAGFDLNYAYMCGEIGGSTLDDLRDLVGLDTFKYNEDILFKLVDVEGLDMSGRHDILPGKAYQARCTFRDDLPDYIQCVDPCHKDYFSWKPINE